MSTKHTPGPWAVGRAFMWHQREFLTIHHDGKVKPPVAHVIDRAAGVGLDDEDRANAYLIAAAPELLEACRKAEEWLSGWASADPYIDVIRAAIARATGQADKGGAGA